MYGRETGLVDMSHSQLTAFQWLLIYIERCTLLSLFP